uniref:Ribosomal protein L29 n=1 Tax=Laurenciella marilzae TaxID=1413812 RepID=A0A1Z1M180_9FLOR|nr:ribosomal protein L29 [Laurenciella marilzae]ARW59838.1 ribosomal protein L29 [Laurenciella marilzae]
MRKNKKLSRTNYLQKQEELVTNLKKELVLINIRHKTKQNIKPHLIKQIKNKISKVLALGITEE